MVIDLTEHATQGKFGKMVGVSMPIISKLVQAGVLPRDESVGEWLLVYCQHLRRRAAGHVSEEGLDLVQERAALAREQKETAALRNAEMRGELVRAEELYRQLFTVARTARNGLITIADRIAVQAAAEEDAHSVHEMITSEIESVMEEMLEAAEALIDLPEEEENDGSA